MQLEDWLQYLENLPPKKINSGLASIQLIAKRLDLLTVNTPIITVTGTNGKGSTCAMLEGIYLAQNYRTGLYTSPHLLKFNERIRINGTMVADQALCEAFSKINRVREDILLSYFEFTTLAALLLFKKENLDVLILEIGLGGRLDAVNLWHADIAIITNIALDHMEYLGNTREQIALEKAGIVRENMPCICGDENPPANLFSILKEKNVPLDLLNRDFFITETGSDWNWYNKKYELTNLPVTSIYKNNLAVALQAVYRMQNKLPVSELAIKTACQTVIITGRLQLIDYARRKLLLDVSHNPNAVALLNTYLAIHYPNHRCYAVFSMLADKDIISSVIQLNTVFDTWFVAPLPTTRSLSAKVLQEQLTKAGIERVIMKENIQQALAAAVTSSQENDVIVVFGSFYTVAEIVKII